MGKISKNDNENEIHEDDNNDLVPKMEQFLEQFAMFSMNKGAGNFDFSNFSESQIDKILDIVSENENHAFKFHEKKIDSDEKINSKIISSHIVNQITLRFVALSAIFVFTAITIIFVFFKDNFLSQWMSFVTGMVGGFGLRSVGKYFIKDSQLSKLNKNDDDQEDSD
jgi:hypothetical protein